MKVKDLQEDKTYMWKLGKNNTAYYVYYRGIEVRGVIDASGGLVSRKGITYYVFTMPSLRSCTILLLEESEVENQIKPI